MTIKVEREALLRVLERPPSTSFQSSSTTSTSSPNASPIGIVEDDYLLVDFPNKALQSSYDASLLRSLSDEEDSVFTASTTSISDVGDSLERRVSFSEDLVTEEWTRPYTPKKEIADLYYSTLETQRFRQEYRMERKLMSELSMDPDAPDKEELSALVASSCLTPSSRHRISRVVVLHNDKLETFFDPNQGVVKPAPTALNFFDNDSFWSGSITWY